MVGKVPVEALRGVNIKIEKGDFIAILGPSGSGKSTLLNLFGALDKPTSGTLLIDVVDQVHLDRKGKIEYHYVIIDYVVKVKPGDTKAGSDASELKWVPLGEVNAFELPPSFRRFFVKNKKNLETISPAP